MEPVNPDVMSRVAHWLFVGAFFVVGCMHTRYTYQPAIDPIISNPKMIFLTFSIKTDSLKGNQINLIDTKIVDGKPKSEPENSSLENRVVVKQLNEQQQDLSICSIDHPLLKKVEYLSDQSSFETKTINLREAEFFVRTSLNENAKFIRVEEIIDNKNIAFATFKIKE